MRALRFVLAAALATAACSEAIAPKNAPAQSPPPQAGERPRAPGSQAGEWRCEGELVPPDGWQQETAFSDAGRDAYGRAVKDATDGLVARACGQPGSCDFLRALVTTWKIGRSPTGGLCVMVVLKNDDLAAWREQSTSLDKHDEKLVEAAKELARWSEGKARVWIDRIDDAGVPGGPRADWLRTRLEAKLADIAVVVAPPKGWAGDGLPDGVDLVVRAVITQRTERQVDVLEVNWQAWRKDGAALALNGAALALNGAATTVLPVAASPYPQPATIAELPPSSAGLSIRIDAARGNTLCAGERTQLWLKSDKKAFVRVFDLGGDGEALLIYPNREAPSAVVEAGKTMALGDADGFEAVPAPGSEEGRVLVVAAASEDDLGDFKKLTAQCRLPKAVAAQLHRAEGLPARVKFAWTGLRIVETGRCEPLDPHKRAELAQDLAAVPICKLP